jgi:hypothetical protein
VARNFQVAKGGYHYAAKFDDSLGLFCWRGEEEEI